MGLMTLGSRFKCMQLSVAPEPCAFVIQMSVEMIRICELHVFCEIICSEIHKLTVLGIRTEFASSGKILLLYCACLYEGWYTDCSVLAVGRYSC
jgi:hypothetical protein